LLTILTGLGNVTTDLAKGFGAVLRAKTSRHFLFEFHHAEIPFRLIIVKWHLKIIYKSQCFPFAKLEMIDQVLGGVLFGLTAFFRQRFSRFWQWGDL
jgi:hypothetical protein